MTASRAAVRSIFPQPCAAIKMAQRDASPQIWKLKNAQESTCGTRRAAAAWRCAAGILRYCARGWCGGAARLRRGSARLRRCFATLRRRVTRLRRSVATLRRSAARLWRGAARSWRSAATVGRDVPTLWRSAARLWPLAPDSLPAPPPRGNPFPQSHVVGRAVRI